VSSNYLPVAFRHAAGSPFLHGVALDGVEDRIFDDQAEDDHGQPTMATRLGAVPCLQRPFTGRLAGGRRGLS
jgi:hypothetical protein